MAGTQRFSHVAVTVPRDYFEPKARASLLSFYDAVFGWQVNEGMSIEGERIFLRAPHDRQYLTIRASDAPMTTSGYEHLGVLVESRDELQDIYARADAYAQGDEGVELGEMKILYGERLHTFRVRYLLPLTLEVQWIDEAPRA